MRVNMEIDQLRNSINGAINNSYMPMGIVELVLLDILRDVREIKAKEIELERQDIAKEELQNKQPTETPASDTESE